MNRDQSTRPHSAYNPPAARHTPPVGYAPPPGVGSDYIRHPLHRVYTRSLKWIRLRWFIGGLLFGGLLSLGLVFVLSALVYTRIPQVIQNITGEPDLTLTITEGYLNREAARRIAEGYDTAVPGLSLRAAQIDLGPDNRMDYRAEFCMSTPLGEFDLSAGVKNQVTVQEGKLVVSMVGDPQIGNLNVPLDILPANFKDGVRQAVDQVNNTIIASELNRPLEASIGTANLGIDAVTSDDTGLTFYMRQR